MGIVEKYSRGINSSNLRSDEHHFDIDSLTAVSWATREKNCELGSLLFRVKYGNDATTFQALLDAWSIAVADKRQWPKHLPAKKVAEKSLDYWLNDVCPACTGKGVQKLPNVPVMGDEACQICDGTGKKPLMCEANWRDPILDMVYLLDRMAFDAAGRAMKLISNEMDL